MTPRMAPLTLRTRRGVLAGLMASALTPRALALSSPVAPRAVRVRGLDFPLLTWGEPGHTPVLLLHGFPQDPWTWEPVAAALAPQGFQVVAPWQRGYAASNRAGPYKFANLCADCLGLADALGLGRLHVAGFGIGGAVAWLLAARYPERVLSISAVRFPHPAAFAQALREDPEQQRRWRALQDALGAGDPQGQAARLLAQDAAGLKQLLADGGLAPGAMQPYVERYVAHMRSPGALQAALSWEHALLLDELAQVPAVAVPALLLWSEGPPLTTGAAAVTRRYVRARFSEALLPQAQHFVLESAPQAVLQPLAAWLREINTPKRLRITARVGIPPCA